VVSIDYGRFVPKPGNALVIAVVKVKQINVSGQFRWRFYLNRAHIAASDPLLVMVRASGHRLRFIEGSVKAGVELLHPQIVVNSLGTTSAVFACSRWAVDCQITAAAAAPVAEVYLQVSPFTVNHPEWRGRYLTGPIPKEVTSYTSLVCDPHP